MNTYKLYSDESGSYSPNSKKPDKFYVRSALVISAESSIILENRIRSLKKHIGIDDNEKEFKWSYLYQIFKAQKDWSQQKPTEGYSPFLQYPFEDLQQYVKESIKQCCSLPDATFLFTVTRQQQLCSYPKVNFVWFHIQSLKERVEIKYNKSDAEVLFYVDNLNHLEEQYLIEQFYKDHSTSRYIKYKSISKHLDIRKSHHCEPMQVADFAAGAFSSYLRNLDFGTHLFESYLYGKLHRNPSGVRRQPLDDIIGVSLKSVPKETAPECNEFLKDKLRETMCRIRLSNKRVKKAG